MDKIKRFSPEIKYNEQDHYGMNPFARMCEYANGEYVRYEDHQAEVAELQKQIEAFKAEIKRRDRIEAVVEDWDHDPGNYGFMP